MSARLRVEPLEARDNPAHYWDPLPGGNLLASNVNNWVRDDGYGGVVRCTTPEAPTNSATSMVFGHLIPTHTWYRYGQPPLTIYSHLADADCVLTQDGNGVASFTGIRLLPAYTCEIDLQESATVVSLDVRGGKIKQNDPATVGSGDAGTLTVTHGLFWSGGTINSNTVPGKFNLAAGANGTITPLNSGTVDLGSTFTLLGDEARELGSNLEIDPGTIKVNRGDGFVVNMLCLMLVQPKAEEDTSAVDPEVTLDGGPATPVGGILTVKPGGKLLVKAKNRPANNTQPATFVVEGNNAKVYNQGQVEVRDRSFIQVSNTGAAGFEQDQPNANKPLRTILEAGCGITCMASSVIVIRKGTFELAERRGADGVPEDVQDAIVITGTANADWVLQIKQDATLKRADAAPKKPLYLEIREAVKSFAFDGTVELYAVKDQPRSDQIEVTGKGKFGNTSKLKVTWFDNAPAIQKKDESWHLVRSTYTDTMNPQIDQ